MNAVDQIPATRSTKPITQVDYTIFTSDLNVEALKGTAGLNIRISNPAATSPTNTTAS